LIQGRITLLNKAISFAEIVDGESLESRGRRRLKVCGGDGMQPRWRRLRLEFIPNTAKVYNTLKEPLSPSKESEICTWDKLPVIRRWWEVLLVREASSRDHGARNVA
jgi:hypothetical protein